MDNDQIAQCKTQTEGYLSYMKKAERWNKQGVYQKFCRHCKRWKFPACRCEGFEAETDEEA